MHILLITRHYPPEISGGARRPFLLTKAMRAQGHRVTIVTPFEVDDIDNICVANQSINKGLEVSFAANEAQAPKPRTLNLLKNPLRQWLFWPDPDIRWARDVVKKLKKSSLTPDWIITTSPPESIHYTGAKLSRHFGANWLAEFRDTWLDKPHRNILTRSFFRAYLERRIARNFLIKVDAVSAVSETVINDVRTFVRVGTPECIISHFSDSPPSPYLFDNNRLNIVHTGGFELSDYRRNLEPLLNAIESVSAQRPDLVLHLAGRLTPKEIGMAFRSKVIVQLHGPVSLEQSRSMQAGADGLILCTPENSHALPGKYAEYVRAECPILYFGGGDWLKLVERPDILRPLVSGLKTLTKGERCPRGNTLTDTDAAAQLVSFLEATTT